MTNLSDQLGAKLGPRLADLMGRAVVSTTASLTPHKVNTSMQLQERFFRLIASEVAGTVAGLTRQAADDPDVPDALKPVLNFMAGGTGQFAGLLNFAVYGTGLGNGFSAIISNLLAPNVQNSLAAHPHALLPPELAARLVASRIWSNGEGSNESRRSGVSDGRFQSLVEAAQALPALGELITLYQRGRINRRKVEDTLRRAGVREDFIDILPDLAQTLLDADQLSNMVDRGAISHNEGQSRAQSVGVSPADFDKLVELVGVPPANELLLMAYRRGIIDRARLNRGIRQSPLRTEWADVIDALQYDPLSTLQAADAVLQNLMSVADGRKIADQNGTHARDFDKLVEISGRPPGIQEVIDLWNRGEVTESEVRQALLESPLKNKWVPLVMKTRRRIPPQDTVRMMIKNGVLTPAEGVRRFMDVGFSHDDAAALADLAQKDKTETDRAFTKAEIISLYESRLQTRAQAEKLLDDLGYDREEQSMLLALADYRKAKAEMDAAASVVRSKYVAHKLSDNEASSLLDSLHVPADARDHLLNIWGLERDANQRELTPAQVIKAHGGGLIDRPETHRRLVEMGYSDGDAEILISNTFGATG